MKCSLSSRGGQPSSTTEVKSTEYILSFTKLNHRIRIGLVESEKIKQCISSKFRNNQGVKSVKTAQPATIKQTNKRAPQHHNKQTKKVLALVIPFAFPGISSQCLHYRILTQAAQEGIELTTPEFQLRHLNKCTIKRYLQFDNQYTHTRQRVHRPKGPDI